MIDLQNLDKFYLDDFVKDIFIGFLQKLFNENLGEFHYDYNQEVSKVSIADQFNLDNDALDFKPSIYLRRRPMGFANTSIDQLLSKNVQTATSTRSDLITGTIEIVCVSREGLEASRLAGLVFLLVHQFRHMFRKFGMHDVSVKLLGEEEPKDIRTTMRVVEVPVTIQYAFQYTWAVTQMAAQASDSSIEGSESSIGAKTLNGIGIGISTDPITGKKITGVGKDGCGNGDGVSMEDCPTCASSDESHICVPISEYLDRKDN